MFVWKLIGRVPAIDGYLQVSVMTTKNSLSEVEHLINNDDEFHHAKVVSLEFLGEILSGEPEISTGRWIGTPQ